MPSDGYRQFLIVFYPVFFIFTFLTQTLLLYLITRHSPKNLQTLRFILTNTSIIQLVICFVCCFCQYRQITTSIPVVLWSYGPCKYLEAHICFIMYEVFQTSSFTAGMSIVVTFYFKYHIINNITLTKSHMIKSFVLFHIPVFVSIVAETIMVINQSLPEETRQYYLELNENIEEYSVIGILSLKSIPSILNFSVISGSVLTLPLLSLYFRNKIMHHINSKFEQSSVLKHKHNKTFVKGLTIQALLPITCYIPVFGLYFFCLTTKIEVLFQQYFMTVVPTFTVLIDPIVSIYFVTPYRRKLKKWTGISKEDSKHVQAMTI